MRSLVSAASRIPLGSGIQRQPVLRRIAVQTGVCRKTAGSYLKVAGLDLRPSGRWGRGPPKVANEVTTDFGAGIESSGVARAAAELATDPQRPLGSQTVTTNPPLPEDSSASGALNSSASGGFAGSPTSPIE